MKSPQVRSTRKRWRINIPRTIHKIIYVLFGRGVVCDRCLRPGQWYRQNTMYHHEPSNWVYMCDDCRVDNDAYWEEMWKEFYSE